MKKYIVGFITLIVVALAAEIYWNYIQQYHQDSNNTATSGIIFKTTLNLDEYKNVSQGNDMWGTFNRYSRSDRHDETITVYCKGYCK